MENKLKCFISNLTDDEIDEQLKDIFGWAKIYQKLLEDERYNRFKAFELGPNYNDLSNEYDELLNNREYTDLDEPEIEVNDVESDTSPILDYYLVETIQQKVSCLSAEETKDKIEKLKNLNTTDFSPMELAQLYFEIDCCELHYFELAGITIEDECICPNCKCELEANAKFCGKCGLKIK